jgi:uncharacterized protein YjiS (DUF1127 family)
MIMSTISSAADQRATVHRPGTLRTLVTAPKRLCIAYFTWRVAQTITLLRAMSDQELDDVGLAPPDLQKSKHPLEEPERI